MKVLIVDPWSGQTSIYPNGLCYGLADLCELDMIGSFYYKNTSGALYNIYPYFFKYSEQMKESRFRKVVRGLEYIRGYQKVIKQANKVNYDVIHIQWLLQFDVDLKYIPILKKNTKKLVYTAHNVLPHIGGEDYIEKLRSLYEMMDVIILHGNAIKKEFVTYFPEFEYKIRIQYHGTYLNQVTDYDDKTIEEDLKEKVNCYNRIYLFIGGIFYNKGADILVDLWNEHLKNENSLLIVAGKIRDNSTALETAVKKLGKTPNFLFLKGYIEDNLMNYLINNSNIIMLPYRHASMSGVIFTAAEFSKTVLCTRTGSIEEYLDEGEDSFVCNPNNQDIWKKWKEVIDSPNSRLDNMGKKLHDNIERKYSWKQIAKGLVSIYSETLKKRFDEN